MKISFHCEFSEFFTFFVLKYEFSNFVQASNTLDISLQVGSITNHFTGIHLLSKIALCDEQNLPKSVHRNEQINGKIWWILPKAGKQNGGYTRKHIIKRKKFRLYTKTYNKMGKV